MSEKQNETTGTSEKEVKGGTEGEATAKPTNVDDKQTSPSSSNKTSKEVSVRRSLTPDQLKSLDYRDFDTPARMLALGEAIANSKFCPLKTKEDVALAMMTGRELGLPMMTSLTQIYPIEGKPSLGTHLIRALIIKAGIFFEKLEDAIPIYSYVKTDENGNVLVTVNKEGKKIPIPLGQGPISEEPVNSKKKLIGYRTTYEFSRQLKQPDNTFKTLIGRGSFSTMEAAEAGLLEKDNWTKYYRRMLDARAFNNGAREIADDVVAGLHSPDELGANSYINEAGEEVIDVSHEEIN